MSNPMPTCHWLVRWIHRGRRKADRDYLLTSLQEYAARMYPAREFGRRVQVAWDLHKSMPGQEHWHCACAIAEGAQ